MPRSLKKGP
ncbi:MAG: hypothetical protein GTN76_01940, partial [Candidatus Aenigmarchaeota archaeon]|nr:hypothetical protein [Candidatus Aenigmarchaeota archaeon]